MTRDREDFHADDGPSSWPEERDCDEPGYDPGPGHEDDDPLTLAALEEKRDRLIDRLNSLEGEAQALQEKIADLEDELHDTTDAISALEDT